MADFDALARTKQGQKIEVNGMNFDIVKVYKGIKVSIVKELTLQNEAGELYLLQLTINDKSLAFWKIDPMNRKPSYQNANLIPIQSVNLL